MLKKAMKNKNIKTKIFLTGSRGFVGKNILEQLKDKYDFIAPNSKELDLTDYEKVEEFLKINKPDIVLHCANVGGNRKELERSDVVNTNLHIFFNLIENKKYFNRMIFCGSGAEFDKRFDIKMVKEEDFGKRIPVDQYGFYKYVCSKYIYNSNFITSLRIFGLFGKYEDYSTRFISNSICRALFNMPISINQNLVFDYIYIDDFIKIVDYFIENKGEYHIYNIGNDKKFELIELAKSIKDNINPKLDIITKKQGLNKEYTCDNTLLKKQILNFNFTDIDSSILATINYYKENINNIKKEDLLFD